MKVNLIYGELLFNEIMLRFIVKVLQDLIAAIRTFFGLYTYILIVAHKSTGYKYFIYERSAMLCRPSHFRNGPIVSAQSLDEAIMKLSIISGASIKDLDLWQLHLNFFDPLKIDPKLLGDDY